MTVPILDTNSSRTYPYAPIARWLTAYLILPNLLFVILGRFVFVTGALFNLDFLLLGAVAGFLPLGLNIATYGLLLAIDAFVSLAPVFHFGLETAVFSVPYGVTLRLGVVALILACAVSISTTAVLSAEARAGHRRRPVRPGALVIVAALIGLDALAGTNGVFRADAAISVNIATSA